MAFGETAAMTQPENKMIEDPLNRMMERLDLDTSKIVGVWTDPIMLLLGLVAWGSRVWRESRKPGDGPSDDRPPDTEPDPEPPEEEKKDEAPKDKKPGKDNEKDPEEQLESIDAPDSVREGLPGHG